MTTETQNGNAVAPQETGLLAIIPAGQQRQQFFLYQTVNQAEAAVLEATSTNQFRYRHDDGSTTVIQGGPGTQFLITSKSTYDKAVEARKLAAQEQAQRSPQA